MSCQHCIIPLCCYSVDKYIHSFIHLPAITVSIFVLRYSRTAVQTFKLYDAAGGFRSFSSASPHLVRSDLWNTADTRNSSLGDRSSHNDQLCTDTYRCHPSMDQVRAWHCLSWLFACLMLHLTPFGQSTQSVTVVLGNSWYTAITTFVQSVIFSGITSDFNDDCHFRNVQVSARYGTILPRRWASGRCPSYTAVHRRRSGLSCCRCSYLEQPQPWRHVRILYVCFPRTPEGFPLQTFFPWLFTTTFVVPAQWLSSFSDT